MNNVLYKKLKISNFGGISRGEFDFSPSGTTTFKGPTGCGKSTIAKAIRYCFGFLVQNFLPENNSKQVLDIETKCELVLSINDVEHIFVRGSSQQKDKEGNFSGNLGFYFIDDMVNPLKEKEYMQTICNLLNLEKAEIDMLCTISSFSSKKWDEMREFLDKLIGTQQLCLDLYSQEKYAELWEIYGTNTNEITINKEIEAQRKKIKAQQLKNKSLIESAKSKIDTYTKLDFDEIIENANGGGEMFKQWIIQELSQEIELLKTQSKEVAVEDLKYIMKQSLIKDFSKEKVSCILPQINKLFENISFSLETQTISGDEIKQQCEIIYTPRGSTYSQASCGEKIIIDFNISKGLREIYDIAFPMIIDEAQSCTIALETSSQKIELRTEMEQNFECFSFNL